MNGEIICGIIGMSVGTIIGVMSCRMDKRDAQKVIKDEREIAREQQFYKDLEAIRNNRVDFVADSARDSNNNDSTEETITALDNETFLKEALSNIKESDLIMDGGQDRSIEDTSKVDTTQDEGE